MASRFHSRGAAVSRSIAVFCAAVLLVSQLVGVAHFHDSSVSHASAQISLDAGFCPVCQLAMHSPGSVATATTVARGPLIAEAVFVAAPVTFESPVFSAARVRAPPLAL